MKMKRVIIGCCLAAVGSFSSVCFLLAVSFYVDSLSGWSSPPGRFFTAFSDTGLSVLLFPLLISIGILGTGLYILWQEYQGDKKSISVVTLKDNTL